MPTVFEIIAAVLDRASEVILFPLDPKNRIYWLYLITSAFAAFFVYRAIRARGEHATDRDAEAASGTFLEFLFPKSVWSHPSAWLDLKYVFFHKIVSHFLLFGIGGTALIAGYRWTSGGKSITDVVDQGGLTSVGDWAVAIGYMIVVMAVLDFIAFFIHFLQHKIPLLWQFHKVHHSAEVMHPISNYREHPIDNLAYGAFIGLGFGVMNGLSERLFGFLPTMPTLLGIPFLMFLFNVVAYNLRHSHVWLRWPGVWSIIFPSPAHHHVHHSCHPEHIDKNFAFMFPVWDVLFGTYIMPDDNRDVKFGVPEEQGRDLDGVLKLYWVPFRDAFRLFKPKPEDTKKSPEIETDETQVPAE